MQAPDLLHEQLIQAEAKVNIDLIEGKQPLLISLLYSVSEDLKALHSQLDKFKISNQIDKMYIISLMTKQGTHARLLMEAVEHMRQAEMAMAEVLRVKEQICVHIYSTR